MVDKGVISSLEGPFDRDGHPTKARVLIDGFVSYPIDIPRHLRGDRGGLSVGAEVAFAYFSDLSGAILAAIGADGTENGAASGENGADGGADGSAPIGA